MFFEVGGFYDLGDITKLWDFFLFES